MTGLPFTTKNVSSANAFAVQDCGHVLNVVSTDNGRFRCLANTATLQGVKGLGNTTYMTYNQFYDGVGDLNLTGSFTYSAA